MRMDWRTFQALLSAGFRLRAREQLLALSASSFPMMEEKDRRGIVDQLERSSEVPQPEEAGTTGGDIDKLRAWVALDAMKHPMPPRRLQRPSDAPTEEQSEPDEGG